MRILTDICVEGDGGWEQIVGIKHLPPGGMLSEVRWVWHRT